MSAYSPVNMWEGLYLGAAVWWRQLLYDDMNPCGRIYGFVWDTNDNGILVEFAQEKFMMRYFLSFRDLQASKCWIPEEGGIFMIDKAKFIELIELEKLKVVDTRKTRPFIMNGKRLTVSI